MTETCETCRCFLADAYPETGTCRFYPVPQPKKHSSDWCGQYQPVAEPTQNDSNATLPQSRTDTPTSPITSFSFKPDAIVYPLGVPHWADDA